MGDRDENILSDCVICTGHAGHEHMMKIIHAVDVTICDRVLVRPQDFHDFRGVPHDVSIDLMSVLEKELEKSTHDRDWSCDTAGDIIIGLENACTTMYVCRTGIAEFDYGRQEDVDKLHAFLYTFILVSLGDHNHGELLDKFDYLDNDE